MAIDDTFAAAVASAVGLVALRLSAARLADAGAKHLATGLAANGSIREVHLDGNELTKYGVKALVKSCLEREARPLWTLSLSDQTPPLERCDVRDAARDVDDARPGAARLRDVGGDRLDSAAFGSYGFLPVDLLSDARGADLAPPLAVADGDAVQVRWVQQRVRGATSSWRDATVVDARPSRSSVRVKYVAAGGFVENVSRWLLRAPPTAVALDPDRETGAVAAGGDRRAKTVVYVARDGQVVKMPVDAIADKLADDNPELKLLNLNGKPDGTRRRGPAGALVKAAPDLVARRAPDGESRPCTREEMRDAMADQHDELRLFGYAPRVTTAEAAPSAADADADAARPVDAVHLLVDNAASTLLRAPFPALVDNLDYVKFAEENRRSRTTTIIF